MVADVEFAQLGHMSSQIVPTAGGTEPALLATECHQLLDVAVLAAHAKEPFLQPAALQTGLELLLQVSRQWPTSLGSQITECGIVLLDETVEQCRLGPMTDVSSSRRCSHMAGVVIFRPSFITSSAGTGDFAVALLSS